MKFIFGLCALVLFAAPSGAESRLRQIDVEAAATAAFSAAARGNQLDCEVSRQKPSMGIDLRFHTGFHAAVPLKKLAGGAGAIHVLVRVTPKAARAKPAYFEMTTPTPEIAPGTKGAVELKGEYAVGPGRYGVDWLLSFGDAVCRERWNIEAKSKGPFSQVPLAMAANSAAELPPDPFDEPGELVPRAPHSLYVKALVNFSPAGVDSTILDTDDVRAITEILRAVSREPRFGRFSVVAFSSDQERVLHRQPVSPTIDFGALGREVRKLQSGVVSFRQMQDPGSTTRFLEQLLGEELGAGEQRPDAVVLISPKLSLEEKLSKDELVEETNLTCPLFLLSYNPQPIADPWQGVLADAIKKAYKGLEYTISGPHDLGKALLRLNSELPGGGSR